MKIERISDNQIRCTLNKEDLEGKETLLSELAFGSEKAKGLFRELMNKAATELGFETNEENSQKLLKAFTQREGWDKLKAVKNKQVYSAHHGLPREIYDCVVFEYLAKTYYPEEFADIDPEATLKEFYEKFLPFSYGGTWFMHLNQERAYHSERYSGAF